MVDSNHNVSYEAKRHGKTFSVVGPLLLEIVLFLKPLTLKGDNQDFFFFIDIFGIISKCLTNCC